VSRRELAVIAFFSVLVHGGIAAAAYQGRDAKPTLRRVSRVELDIARPLAPPKPLLPPPPPPPAQKPAPKPVAAQPKPEPVATPLPTPAPETPVDTGSSAPPAEDGELFAGSGGLGTAAPPAPPPPPAPVLAPPKPEPVIQAREGANYMKNPRPAYPGRARREGWEGTTLLRVQVSPSGRPGAIQVQKSSGRQLLDDAASEAVKRWTFSPATQGGQAIAGWVTVPIVFRLQ
jgi:periplasmic protein TonB